MPTFFNRHPVHGSSELRPGAQRAALSVGGIFLVIGFAGIFMPGMFGMHLSMFHNFIHILTGSIALYSGYTSSNKAFNFCAGFGVFFGLLGVVGFLMGEPGYPDVGYRAADQNLFRVLPNILEFGTIDHVFHLLMGSFLLFTAYTFRKDRAGFYKREERISEHYTLNEVNRRGTLGQADYDTKARK